MRSLFVAALALACAGSLPLSAFASSDEAAVAAQGFLPKNVIPSLYVIDVVPNLKTGKIAGREKIQIDVRAAANTIVVNATQTTFGPVTLDGMPAKVSVDAKSETATFSFAKPVSAGHHVLDISYVATLQQSAQGLFDQVYADPSGKDAHMLATQMEATDGRRMFPSFDEPAFKARFILSAVVPRNWTAVSNTPVVSVVPVEGNRKRVKFAPTPIMSTYLVVLAAGDFDQVHAMSDGIKLGVYATRGKASQMTYALDVMKQLMPYFDSYYGVKFPIAKLDTIAIPGGFNGAMENWGGITYNEQTVLFDPKTDAQDDKQGIYGIIAHEESHQWNGDLTTMPWWDELWLAEGFATWMETKAPDHFHPEWNQWLQADRAVDGALDKDALPSTHAAYVPVHNDTEIAAVFDDISYTKAGAVLRMLEAYVGPDKFRQALQHYFRTHQYTSANAADLWKDLSDVSGDDVAAIAQSWIYEPGFPLVTANAYCTNGKRSISLSQQRYRFDPSADPGTTLWQIPLNVELNARSATTTPALFATKTTTIDGGDCDAPLIVNGNDVGYYRVKYDAATQAVQRKNFVAISLADRLSLLDDSWAFARSGRAKIDEYLAYVEADSKDADPHVLGPVLDNFGAMLRYERDKAGDAAFKAYLIARLRPIVARFGGWEGAGMSDEQLEARNTALTLLAQSGDAATLAQGRARFEQYVKNPSKFAPLNRDAILNVAGLGADKMVYAQLIALGTKATDPNDQQRYFFAAFSATDEALAMQNLQMSLHLPAEFASYAPFIVALVGDRHPKMAWKFLNDNVKPLFGPVSEFERVAFITDTAKAFWQGIPADQIEAFLKANVPAGGEKEIEKAMLSVKVNQELAARLVPQIDAYVAGHPATK